MSLLQALNLPKPAGVGSKGAPAAKPGAAANGSMHADAAAAWREAHRQADERIKALQAAVKAHCADAPAALLQEIEKGLAKLDTVLETLDHRLAASLSKAGEAKDEAARKAELANAKTIWTEYLNYVKGDPLVAHIDQNPFGVKTGLVQLLGSGLDAAAKVI
jgi:hypothetical protein